MRVLLADDHAIVRRGTRELLVEEFPNADFVEVSTGEAAVASLGTKFDVAIIDLSMPGRGGLDAVKAMHERAPRLQIVVMSQHAESTYAVRALRSGARAYVTKDSATDELVRAVRAVRAGRTYVSASIASALADAVANPPSATPHDLLSDRELQVLRMLGKGQSIKDIASELALSDKTASTYRRRILDKLALTTTAELIRYAMSAKLVD